ncbi:anti-sigma regulatory factor [Thiocystis violacea]|uniref:anti-sigma regulatory factor n=1 Tax=Thiocystis violacea TaxID=13725 RepID=UPI001905EB3B|nr:anti-sigma regulatory factor [Thiocystis violacea]MBK1719111.1 anti-sigma regulatory factor [Thiocystis violacea]
MPELLVSERIPVRIATDIVIARRAARELCERLGFGKADQTRLATAVSELARNVIQYAGEGVCLIEDRSDGVSRRIRVVVEDQGPGIADLGRALTDGFSTGGGLGAGLPGTRRLVDEFQIESAPGRTCVTIVMAKPF